jgi:hypothetical protein
MGPRALRHLAAPRRVTVIAAPSGVPHVVVIADRRRTVTAVREDWLVQDRWWTEEPVDRHYFDLLLEHGRPLVVFREALSGEWFTHDVTWPNR